MVCGERWQQEANPAQPHSSSAVASAPTMTIDRAADRIDDAGKLDEQPVAGGFGNATAMFLNFGIRQVSPDCFQGG